MIHTYHEDVHEYGLADGCPRCRQQAERPLETLDDTMLRALFDRLASGQVARSLNEGLAMDNLRSDRQKALRIQELDAGDLVR